MKKRRLKLVLKHIDTAKKGIEVAPYQNPILPKAAGYDVCILDVFDTQTLRANAARDANIRPAQQASIEEVDIVSDACDMGAVIKKAGVAGQFSYVLSSHNFEHLPNPIKFLQGVGVALRTGGVLSMVMPDYRCCFDRHRLPTRLSDWLVAYHTGKAQPSPADRFDAAIGVTNMAGGIGYKAGLDFAYRPKSYVADKDFNARYQEFCTRLKEPGPYGDTHCNVLFPELLELYLRDLLQLGLIDLALIEPPISFGVEIIVHLKKVENHTPQSGEDYSHLRQNLLRRITREMSGHRRNMLYYPLGFVKFLNDRRRAKRQARMQAEK